MKEFLLKFGSFSIGPVVGALFSFVTVPVTTYFINPEEYGKVSMFVLAQTVITVFLYLGMDQAYLRKYTEIQNKNVLLFNSLLLPCGVLFILEVILFFFRKELSILLFGTAADTYCVGMLMLILPFKLLEQFLLCKLRMEEKGTLYSLFTILLKAFILVFSVAFLLLLDKNYETVVLATTVSEIVVVLVLLFANLSNIRLKKAFFNKELLKELLMFGLPLVPAALIGWMLNSMDKIMLRTICGYAEVGLYSAAFKMVSVLSIVQQAFTLFWVPMAYRWKANGVSETDFSKVGKAVAGVMSFFLAGILLFKDVIVMILSSDYISSKFIMPFLLLYPVMYTVSEVTVLGIYFSKKSIYTIIVAAISSGVNIVLNLLLIPQIGAVGAAVATGIAYIIFFWVRTLISRRLWYSFPLKDYILYTVLLIVLCAVNTFWDGVGVYLITGLSIIVIGFINRKEIRWLWEKVKIYCKKE